MCELAVHFLEEACENAEILKIVVDMQPTLEHLGEVANSLLFKYVRTRVSRVDVLTYNDIHRFMSMPVGFRYLYDVGFINREMDMWYHVR